MGYFPNGSAAEYYCAQYCAHCKHGKHVWSEDDMESCPVWDAHILHNYDECNKPTSILHILIPRDDKGYNEQCSMFMPFDAGRCMETEDMFGG